MSASDTRNYAIIRWNPGVDVSLFNQLKGEGVQQTSMATIRKSIDGKKALLKWQGAKPASLTGLIIATGDDDWARAQMATAEWAQPDINGVLATPVLTTAAEPTGFRSDVVDPPKEPVRWKQYAAWTAGAAAAASATWAAIHYLA